MSMHFFAVNYKNMSINTVAIDVEIVYNRQGLQRFAHIVVFLSFFASKIHRFSVRILRV